MGPYALFQDDRHGAGIRPAPYTRDMAVQPPHEYAPLLAATA